MIRLEGVIFALLLVSSSIAPHYHSELAKSFDFEWTAKAPGNALAFRLSKKAKIQGSICLQGVCYKAQHKWLMVAVPMNYAGNLGILLQGPRGSWALRSYKVENPLFQRSQKHMIQLRLPAQVVRELEGSESLISADYNKDQEIYKSFRGPWSTRWRWPVESSVTSKFGSMRVPPHGAPYAHTGVDLRAPMKTIVRACSDGVVLDTSTDPIYGNVLTIDHGKGLLSRYMHLSAFKTNVGTFVKAGDVIALSGTTGRSEAPHLHWEMRLRGTPIDPLQTKLLLEHLAYLE